MGNQLPKTVERFKLAIAAKIKRSVDNIPISLCKICEIKVVFSVFSKRYLTNKEPININGKRGREFIISFEKGPKKKEMYLNI